MALGTTRVTRLKAPVNPLSEAALKGLDPNVMPPGIFLPPVHFEKEDGLSAAEILEAQMAFEENLDKAARRRLASKIKAAAVEKKYNPWKPKSGVTGCVATLHFVLIWVLLILLGVMYSQVAKVTS